MKLAQHGRLQYERFSTNEVCRINKTETWKNITGTKSSMKSV